MSGVGSSWFLWSAVLANNNTVVTFNDKPHLLPSSVLSLQDVPLLRNPNEFKESAMAYGIPFGTFSNSAEHRRLVMEYYRNTR